MIFTYNRLVLCVDVLTMVSAMCVDLPSGAIVCSVYG